MRDAHVLLLRADRDVERPARALHLYPVIGHPNAVVAYRATTRTNNCERRHTNRPEGGTGAARTPCDAAT